MYIVTNNQELRLPIQGQEGALEVVTGNHLELVRALLQRYSRAFLVSPFLFADFEPLLDDLDLSTSSLELVTTCAAKGNDQLTKPFSMRSFGRIHQQRTGAWPAIHIDNKLHSKVYIFYDGELPAVGIVTSANLTRSGLQFNSETGVIVTDAESLVVLRRTVERSLAYVHLTEHDVGYLCQAVDSTRDHYSPAADIDLGLGNLLASSCAPAPTNAGYKPGAKARFYIKVTGHAEAKILPQDRRPFDAPHPELSFAKNPTGIKHGDILLEVAVGGMCFLTYYACTSGSAARTPQEKLANPDYHRWGFYMHGNNLSPAFGANWFEDPLMYADVISRFHTEHPGQTVTLQSDDIRGAIQHGHSFFEVSRPFGEFVRRLIDERAASLSLP